MARKGRRHSERVQSALESCPTCGQPGRPIMYGLPTSGAVEAAKAGLLVTPGCLRPLEAPDWDCPNGHRWVAEDQSRSESALRNALRGRPHCLDCDGPSVVYLYPIPAGRTSGQRNSAAARPYSHRRKIAFHAPTGSASASRVVLSGRPLGGDSSAPAWSAVAQRLRAVGRTRASSSSRT